MSVLCQRYDGRRGKLRSLQRVRIEWFEASWAADEPRVADST